MAEIGRVILTNPIVFLDQEPKGLELYSLQGLMPETNLMINTQGQWLTEYIPARYRALPFVLASDSDRTIGDDKILCYIDDVINAILKTLKNIKTNGEIINIGSNKPVRIKDLIIRICSLVGSGKPIFGKIKLRKDEIKSLYPNINKAYKILKWRPKISLNTGLKKTIKYYKNAKFN